MGESFKNDMVLNAIISLNRHAIKEKKKPLLEGVLLCESQVYLRLTKKPLMKWLKKDW